MAAAVENHDFRDIQAALHATFSNDDHLKHFQTPHRISDAALTSLLHTAHHTRMGLDIQKLLPDTTKEQRANFVSQFRANRGLVVHEHKGFHDVAKVACKDCKRTHDHIDEAINAQRVAIRAPPASEHPSSFPFTPHFPQKKQLLTKISNHKGGDHHNHEEDDDDSSCDDDVMSDGDSDDDDLLPGPVYPLLNDPTAGRTAPVIDLHSDEELEDSDDEGLSSDDE